MHAYPCKEHVSFRLPFFTSAERTKAMRTQQRSQTFLVWIHGQSTVDLYHVAFLSFACVDEDATVYAGGGWGSNACLPWKMGFTCHTGMAETPEPELTRYTSDRTTDRDMQS